MDDELTPAMFSLQPFPLLTKHSPYGLQAPGKMAGLSALDDIYQPKRILAVIRLGL
jgi:hypothetical protein